VRIDEPQGFKPSGLGGASSGAIPNDDEEQNHLY
jgi:hypothetical protein